MKISFLVYCLVAGILFLLASCIGCTLLSQENLKRLDSLSDKWIEAYYAYKAGNTDKEFPETVNDPQETDKVIPAPEKPDAAPLENYTLVWKYGGFKGPTNPNAGGSIAVISETSWSGNNMTYKAVVPSNWGGEGGAPNATIVAVFFKEGDVWVGGKMDWVGYIGKLRPMQHCYAIECGGGAYNGWNRCPMPEKKGTEFVLVLVRGNDAKKYSNAIKGVVK